MPPCYSTRLDDALALVTDAFRSKRRKATNIPYLTHLLSVMVTVAEYEGSEDQQIAALLHDYLEDIEGTTVEELRERFGDPVATWVLALSDSTELPKPPWLERKTNYLKDLALEPGELKLISAADKLHNARSILRDHEAIGEKLWERFTADRAQTHWYYREVTTALESGWHHPIVDELRHTVIEIHQRTREPIPSSW